MKHLIIATLISVASVSLLLAKPKAHYGSMYEMASFAQKREIVRIEYEFHKKQKSKTEPLRLQREQIEFEIDNLQIDLEEAYSKQQTAKAKEIFNSISEKQEALRQNKQEEKNIHFSIDEERIKSINAVLGAK